MEPAGELRPLRRLTDDRWTYRTARVSHQILDDRQLPKHRHQQRAGTHLVLKVALVGQDHCKRRDRSRVDSRRMIDNVPQPIAVVGVHGIRRCSHHGRQLAVSPQGIIQTTRILRRRLATSGLPLPHLRVAVADQLSEPT